MGHGRWFTTGDLTLPLVGSCWIWLVVKHNFDAAQASFFLGWSLNWRASFGFLGTEGLITNQMMLIWTAINLQTLDVCPDVKVGHRSSAPVFIGKVTTWNRSLSVISFVGSNMLKTTMFIVAERSSLPVSFLRSTCLIFWRQSILFIWWTPGLCWWHSTFWPVKYSCCLLLQLGLPKYSRTQRHVRENDWTTNCSDFKTDSPWMIQLYHINYIYNNIDNII